MEEETQAPEEAHEEAKSDPEEEILIEKALEGERVVLAEEANLDQEEEALTGEALEEILTPEEDSTEETLLRSTG